MQNIFFYSKHEERIKSYFNNLRDEQYKELISECEKYLNELKKEITIEKFTFAELEEELEKLISCHGKIKVRDIFNSSQRDYAEEKLETIIKS